MERVAIRDTPTIGASVVAVLPGVLELLERVADRKASWLLSRRKFLQGLDFLAHDRLSRRHQEHALDVPFLVFARLDVRLLEWIGAKVEHKRRAQRCKRLLPDAKPLVLLLEEDDLPLIVAKARQSPSSTLQWPARTKLSSTKNFACRPSGVVAGIAHMRLINSSNLS